MILFTFTKKYGIIELGSSLKHSYYVYQYLNFKPWCSQMLFWVQYLIAVEVLTAGSSDDYEVGTNLVGTKFDMKQKQWHTKNRHKNLISKHKPFIALWYAWFIYLYFSSGYKCNDYQLEQVTYAVANLLVLNKVMLK